ncbi:hypothetical protein O8E88_000458 [Flavobacterium psychrophilum]|nr:hypothetical protein [Flavobacterium psychrophilum]
MGFLDFFKNNNKTETPKIDLLLSELKVNPYDFNHNEMQSVEITIDDELNNIIEVSDLTLNIGDKPFEYISLSSKQNGKRSIFLSQNNANEKDLRNLINSFNSVLGEDFVYQKEFNQNDLSTFRNEPNGIFRTWYLKYEISIGFTSQTIYVNIDEK